LVSTVAALLSNALARTTFTLGILSYLRADVRACMPLIMLLLLLLLGLLSLPCPLVLHVLLLSVLGLLLLPRLLLLLLLLLLCLGRALVCQLLHAALIKGAGSTVHHRGSSLPAVRLIRCCCFGRRDGRGLFICAGRGDVGLGVWRLAGHRWVCLWHVHRRVAAVRAAERRFC
jgi:hypothetical protein